MFASDSPIGMAVARGALDRRPNLPTFSLVASIVMDPLAAGHGRSRALKSGPDEGRRQPDDSPVGPGYHRAGLPAGRADGSAPGAPKRPLQPARDAASS